VKIGLISDTHGLLRPEAARALDIAETRIPEAEGARIYVIHDLAQMRIDPAAQGPHAVVSGHSHQPRCERRRGVLFVNPGSAGPRRFSLPISLGYLTVSGSAVEGRLVWL
jgi:uncharacterized protein